MSIHELAAAAYAAELAARRPAITAATRSKIRRVGPRSIHRPTPDDQKAVRTVTTPKEAPMPAQKPRPDIPLDLAAGRRERARKAIAARPAIPLNVGPSRGAQKAVTAAVKPAPPKKVTPAKKSPRTPVQKPPRRYLPIEVDRAPKRPAGATEQSWRVPYAAPGEGRYTAWTSLPKSADDKLRRLASDLVQFGHLRSLSVREGGVRRPTVAVGGRRGQRGWVEITASSASPDVIRESLLTTIYVLAFGDRWEDTGEQRAAAFAWARQQNAELLRVDDVDTLWGNAVRAIKGADVAGGRMAV